MLCFLFCRWWIQPWIAQVQIKHLVDHWNKKHADLRSFLLHPKKKPLKLPNHFTTKPPWRILVPTSTPHEGFSPRASSLGDARATSTNCFLGKFLMALAASSQRAVFFLAKPSENSKSQSHPNLDASQDSTWKFLATHSPSVKQNRRIDGGISPSTSCTFRGAQLDSCIVCEF